MQETMTEMTFKASDIGMSHGMAAMWPLFVLLGLLIVAAVLVLVVHRRTFVRIFSAATATSGMLLVVLFFLPWLGAQCSGTEVQTASGYELAAGETSLSDEMPPQIRQTIDLSEHGQAAGVQVDGTAEATLDTSTIDAHDTEPKPWIYAGLVLAAGLGLLGVTTLLRPSTRGATGALICVLGLAGCALMGYVACIQSFDGWITPKPPEPPTMPMAATSPAPAPVAASDADEGAVLEFRIAPYQPETGRTENIISIPERQRYLRLLQEAGPSEVLRRNMPYVWLAIHDDDERFPDLVVAEYAGRRYLLLHNRPGYVMLHDRSERGWGLEDVSEGRDRSNEPAVDFVLDPRGARQMLDLTSSHMNQHMAMIIDGEVYIAPQIRGRISNRAQITTGGDAKEVADLIKTLRAGSLPAKLDPELVHESSFGPGMEVVMDGMMTDMQSAVRQYLSVRTKWPLFASLSLYVLAIGCGVLMRIKGPGMRASLAPTAAAPPEAAPTPPQPTEPTTPDHQ